MRARTHTWLTTLAFASLVATAATAQINDEGRKPAEMPPMLEETDVPAQPTAEATATVQVEAAVPTPEAGAVQTPAAAIDSDSTLKSSAPAGEETATQEIEIRRDTATAAPEPIVGEPDDLPRTASPLALLALLGLGSSGGAIGLRVARRRR